MTCDLHRLLRTTLTALLLQWGCLWGMSAFGQGLSSIGIENGYNTLDLRAAFSTRSPGNDFYLISLGADYTALDFSGPFRPGFRLTAGYAFPLGRKDLSTGDLLSIYFIPSFALGMAHHSLHLNAAEGASPFLGLGLSIEARYSFRTTPLSLGAGINPLLASSFIDSDGPTQLRFFTQGMLEGLFPALFVQYELQSAFRHPHRRRPPHPMDKIHVRNRKPGRINLNVGAEYNYLLDLYSFSERDYLNFEDMNVIVGESMPGGYLTREFLVNVGISSLRKESYSLIFGLSSSRYGLSYPAGIRYRHSFSMVRGDSFAFRPYVSLQAASDFNSLINSNYDLKRDFNLSGRISTGMSMGISRMLKFNMGVFYNIALTHPPFNDDTLIEPTQVEIDKIRVSRTYLHQLGLTISLIY